MDEPKTLLVDDDVETQLEREAAQSGRTPQQVANQILRSYFSLQQNRQGQVAEDDERWQRYLATGQTVSQTAMRNKLKDLARKAAAKANSS